MASGTGAEAGEHSGGDDAASDTGGDPARCGLPSA